MTKESYQDRLLKAKDQAKLKHLTSVLIQWAAEGQTVVGKIISIADVEGKKNKGTYRMYTMETDTCHAKFSLGAQIDKEFPGDELLQKDVCITYLGEKKLDGGRTMKTFEIVELPPEEGDDDDDAESRR